MIERLLRCAFDADTRALDWLEAGGIVDHSLLGWQSHILAAHARRMGLDGFPDTSFLGFVRVCGGTA